MRASVYRKDGKLIAIEGDPESPISRGHLCPKGRIPLSCTRILVGLKKLSIGGRIRASGNTSTLNKPWTRPPTAARDAKR